MRTARILAILALWMLALTPVDSRAGAASDATAHHDTLASTDAACAAAGRTPGHHAAAHHHPNPRVSGHPDPRRRLR